MLAERFGFGLVKRQLLDAAGCLLAPGLEAELTLGAVREVFEPNDRVSVVLQKVKNSLSTYADSE